MGNKLSELSKPVAYSLRFRNMHTGEPDKNINANTTFSTLEKAKAYGLGTRYVTQDDGKIVNVRDPSQDPIVEPLYSQEYVSALLSELEAKDERIGELEAIATGYAGKFQKAQDANKHLIIMSNDDKKRIAELEVIRTDASQVFKEIGNELGCNPDNESIMMAIDDLKATQMTGTLAMIIKRAEEMERILEGVTPEMIAGGWTAKGISDYAKSLEAKLATPVRLTDERTLWAGEDDYDTGHVKGWNANRLEQSALLKKQGFTVEGDE